MRVLVITPWYPSAAHSGSGVFNQRDAHLLARSHEVRVLHLLRPDWSRHEPVAPERIEGTEVVVRRVPYQVTRPETWAGTWGAIREELRAADLLHTMAFPALLPFTALRVRIPWVHTEHWSGLGEARSGVASLAGRVLQHALLRPDEVVAVSESLAKAIAPRSRREPKVIGNAVEMPSPETHAESLHSEGPVRAVAVGGLVPGKGALIAISTLAELRARGVDATLRWVGSGPQQGDAQALIAEYGLEDKVQLLGQLDRQRLETELLRANLFLLPTAGETFGVALAEALACGLPVVTSGVGGHISMLNGFAGVRVAPREATALADAVQSLRAREAATAAAQQHDDLGRAREIFSEDRRARQYAEVYDRALASSSDRLG